MKGIAIAVLVSLVAVSAQAAEEFLTAEEMAKLKPVAGADGAMRYSPGGKLARDYPKVLIGGVTFFYDDESKGKGVDPDDLKDISDAMKQALVQVLSKDWQIVHQPGADVAQVNLAVTNIELKNKKRGLLGYTPIGLVATTAGNLAGKRMTLGNAGLQGEVIDSASGNLVNLFAVEKIGEFDDKKGMSWEDVRLAFIDAASKALAEQKSR
jgi:hypothetical protein